MIPHHRNLTPLKEYDISLTKRYRFEKCYSLVEKVYEILMLFDVFQKGTWITNVSGTGKCLIFQWFWKISEKCLFLKTKPF